MRTAAASGASLAAFLGSPAAGDGSLMGSPMSSPLLAGPESALAAPASGVSGAASDVGDAVAAGEASGAAGAPPQDARAMAHATAERSSMPHRRGSRLDLS